MPPDICLGTAQFGMAYGITNRDGQVSQREVIRLLQEADKSGLHWIDTAQAYGNAEAVIGNSLPLIHRFQIVSKLPSQNKSFFTKDDCALWEHAFQSSIQALGVSQLNAFLLHNSGDLRKSGGEYLERWLYSLRERDLVKRLGLSIYERQDLEGVSLDLLDLVQLPLSLYDQRLLSDGTIDYLYDHGCAIHARSLYLQGLLINDVQYWPDWVDNHSREHHKKLHDFANNLGVTLLDLVLNFAYEQKYVEAIVLGLCSCHELQQLLGAWGDKGIWQTNEPQIWSLSNSDILDPRNWRNLMKK